MVYYAASANYCMQPSDIDILPPEKIAFIAYNVGIFESVQKFGNLITSGKISGGMDACAAGQRKPPNDNQQGYRESC
jgi:hypothetical protein